MVLAFRKAILIKNNMDLKSSGNNNTNLECAICHENIRYNNICSTSCGHLFDVRCILTWLIKYSKTCPQCRQGLDVLQTKMLCVSVPTKTKEPVDLVDNCTDKERASSAASKCEKQQLADVQSKLKDVRAKLKADHALLLAARKQGREYRHQILQFKKEIQAFKKGKISLASQPDGRRVLRPRPTSRVQKTGYS